MMGERELIPDSTIVSDWKIKSDSAVHLQAAIDMAFPNEKSKFGFFKKDGPNLMLYHEYGAKQDDASPLPYPLTKKNAYDFIYAWLHSYESGERLGNGQAIGFQAEWFDFGENFKLKITAVNIYYSK